MSVLIWLFIGLGLLVLELFVPSFGILGIAGVLAIIAGVTKLALMQQDPQMVTWIIVGTVGGLLVLGGLFAYLSWRLGFWKKWILRDEIRRTDGYVAPLSQQQWIGHTGTTLTALRPAGVIDIAGQRLDVVTRGEFIPEKTTVVVLDNEGVRLIVKQQETAS
jgi:membrane-bound serine protease (ClpP class)